MNRNLMFVAGLAVGYVLGTRAGRERFDQIRGAAKEVWESKSIQDAAETVEEQAGRLYESGKQMLSEQSHKMQ